MNPGTLDMTTDLCRQDRDANRLWSHTASHRRRQAALPRPALLLICILALATGLALLGAATAFTDHPPPTRSRADIPSSSASIGLAASFYAAVNDVMETGDTAPLADIVAPGLVEHSGRSGDTGAAGLARTVLAERTTWPGIRIVVDDLRVTGPDAITAWVHPETSAPPDAVGFAATAAPASWGPIEVLRIAGGRIVDRWASGRNDVLLEPLGQLPPIDTQLQPVVQVERHTLQAGASDKLIGGAGAGPRLLYVEYGTVSVAVSLPPGATPTRLVARDVLAIAANVGATVMNTGAEPAMILIAGSTGRALQQNMEFYAPTTPANAAVAVVLLTFLPVPKTGQPTLERVMLEPGVTLTPGANIGQTLILVEQGTSWMTLPDDRSVQIRTNDGALHLREPGEALVPGDLVHIGAGLTGAWQTGADEPVMLLVLSTGPANLDTA